MERMVFSVISRWVEIKEKSLNAKDAKVRKGNQEDIRVRA
jgi:hypothetical protein